MQMMKYKPQEPTPLVGETPPAQPYPVDALGPLKGAVEAAAAKAGCPVGIAAGSALGIASLAVQDKVDVQTLGGYRPVSLFLLTIAKSGERKSAVDAILAKGLRDYESVLAKDYPLEMARWATANELYEMKRKAALASAKTNETAARADLEALGEAPPQPLAPFRALSDITSEGLTKALGVSHPSLALFSDEAGSLLGGFGMSKDHRLKTLAALSSFWDGAPVKRARSLDGFAVLVGKRVCLHWMVQPVVADPFLSDAIALGQGFLPRCLVTHPPSKIGTRMAQQPYSAGELDRWNHDLKRHLEWTGQERQMSIRQLPLSPEARKAVLAFYMDVERAQRPDGPYEGFTGFASKATEHACRIAGVLTIWANSEAIQVNEERMGQAITLADYYLKEAVRLCGGASVPAGLSEAEALRLWLLAKAQDVVSVRSLVRRGPSSMRNTTKVRAALAVLERHGWLVPLGDGAEVDGHKTNEAYKVVLPDTPCDTATSATSNDSGNQASVF